MQTPASEGEPLRPRTAGVDVGAILAHDESPGPSSIGQIDSAPSLFILAVTALAGTFAQIATGTCVHGIHPTVHLGIRFVVGVQVAARLSKRVWDVWIIRSLAISLATVGVRSVLMA